MADGVRRPQAAIRFRFQDLLVAELKERLRADLNAAMERVTRYGCAPCGWP